MPRSDLTNPVIPSLEHEELYRAMADLIDQLRQRDAEAGRVFTIPWYSAAAEGTIYPIPRVGKEGFGLGRVSFVFTADTTFSATDYFTFTLYRYFTDTSGVRQKRLVPNGSWGTNVVAPRAHIPYSLEMDHPLDPGDSAEAYRRNRRIELKLTSR